MAANLGKRVRSACAAAAVMFVLPDVQATPPDALAQVTLPIVQARAGTGSRIRQALPKMTIPATDPYDRLTPQQKAELRALFTNLAESDEPPYPAEGLLPVAKSIVFALSDGAIGEGDLFMTVLVDENGDAKSTSVYATPSSRVSREAATVLMKVKYKPAICAGKPCSSEFPFKAHFDTE
jgi:hypothetical protein